MFIGIKMSDDIPTKEGFIRNSIDLDRSKGWELVSASTIMKNEFTHDKCVNQTKTLFYIVSTFKK